MTGRPMSCRSIPAYRRSWLPGGRPRCERSGGSRLLEDFPETNRRTAERLAEAFALIPEVGTEFLGFHLESELGRGAIGRVFLARQRDVAGRKVVLKISPDIDGELRNLAQLQHTNVVPIHSVHRAGPLQAVCMPYLGPTTLAHVLDTLGGRPALPESGKELISTLVDRKNSSRTSDTSLPLECPSEAEAPASPSVETVIVSARKRSCRPDRCRSWKCLRNSAMSKRSCGSARGLADGLAHAHERGILHRDLKPANILLTDDGQPMLLDFNLSQDTKPGTSTWALVGGTLPYMAPEQLEAYRKRTCVLSCTSDLYALGVILFQLLTGRHPFSTPSDTGRGMLDRMIADRCQSPPSLRTSNPAVSPAVESIIRHLLEPNPDQRYQSARALQEDLQRQLDDLPLKHAAEPSLREEAEWARRHPRLTSATSVALLAGVLVVALILGLSGRNQQIARLEADRELAQFVEDKKAVQFFLAARPSEEGPAEQGLAKCRTLLDRYQVVDNASWQELPNVRYLGAEDQGLLREQVGELLFFYAQSSALQVWDQPESPQRGAIAFCLAAQSTVRRLLPIGRDAASAPRSASRNPGPAGSQRRGTNGTSTRRAT